MPLSGLPKKRRLHAHDERSSRNMVTPHLDLLGRAFCGDARGEALPLSLCPRTVRLDSVLRRSRANARFDNALPGDGFKTPQLKTGSDGTS